MWVARLSFPFRFGSKGRSNSQREGKRVVMGTVGRTEREGLIGQKGRVERKIDLKNRS